MTGCSHAIRGIGHSHCAGKKVVFFDNKMESFGINTMAQEVVTFGDIVPSQLKVLPLATGAGRVARKSRREFLPVRSQNFTYEASPELEFHVSSGKDMLIPRECWLRFTLNVQGTVDGAADNGVRLSSNGAQGLIRRLEISDRAQRSIETIDEYDHVSNIIGSVYEDKFYGEINNFTEGQGKVTTPAKHELSFTKDVASAFRVPNENYSLDHSVLIEDVDFTAGGVVTKNGGGTFANLTAATILGREVALFTQNDAFAGIGRVVATSGALTGFTVVPAPIAVGTAGKAMLLDEPQRVGYNEDREFTLRLKTGLFESYRDLPLFLMDGLQIKIYLNQPYRPFVMSPISGTSAITYTVSDARFICNMRTPSAEIRENYLEMFSKGMLNYPYISYHTITKFQSGNTASRQEYDLPISKSSIKKVFFVVQSDVERSSLQSNLLISDSYTSDSYRYINAGLAEYQFKIGSMDYPSTPMRIPDKYAADAFSELLVAASRHRDDVRAMRIAFDDWVDQYVGYVDKATTISPSPYSTEPLKRIYGTRFDTIEDDLLSGVKTRGIGTDDHIVAQLDFSDGALKIGSDINTLLASTNRYLLFVFEHSKVLHISKRGILALD